MSQDTIIANTEISFKGFLFKNKRNRTILWIAAAAIVIQFAVFKYFYPFMSYIHGDSFSYINAADKNLSINTYLVGYSNFLRLFSVFTKSDLALSAFQYLLIQSSVLLLLFTLFFHNKVAKNAQLILFSFMVFNPLFLHLANLVSSDGVFLSISLIWFSLLLWIIRRPTTTIIILQAIVCLIAFTVRYNALIYPCITIIAFYLSQLPIRKKILGVTASLLLCGLFITYTSYNYKKLTGLWQYSPFSGWQLANNAMYTYRYVDSADRKPVPEKFRQLDNMVRQYFDTTRDTKKFPVESLQASTIYMWSPGFTLFKYRDSLFKKTPNTEELKKWASMGPLYKSYGIHIIKSYPVKFLQYFIWPNANKYFAPPVEFLQKYNSGNDWVTTQAQSWFNYKSYKVKTRFKNNKVWVLDFFPILSGVINFVMLSCLLCYWSLKGWKYNAEFGKVVFLGFTFWALNAMFTISASSAALRFQSFPIILTTIFAILQVSWMIQLMIAMKTQPSVESYNPTSNAIA